MSVFSETINLSHTDWCQTSRNHIVSPCHFALPTPLQRLRPNSAQAPPAYTYKASRTTTVIDTRVVSCNPHVLQSTHKKNNRKRLPPRAHPAVLTWQFALFVAFQNKASVSSDSTLLLRLFCGGTFFCDSVFEELSPAGGRVVGTSFLGSASFLLLIPLWAVLSSNKNNRKRLPHTHTTRSPENIRQRVVGSSGGPFWRCFLPPPPSVGWCCFPPPSCFALWCRSLFFEKKKNK